LRSNLSGEEIRDWRAETNIVAVFPYNQNL
jgi:hypothetical protein